MIELEQKVMIHGVCRTHNRCLPKTVIQQEVKMKKQKDQIRGTVKVTIVKDNINLADLVAVPFMILNLFTFLVQLLSC